MGGRFTEQPPASFRQAFRFIKGKAGKPRFPATCEPFGRTANGKGFRAFLPKSTGQRHTELAASPRNDLGVGTLWVTPYMEAANAQFYEYVRTCPSVAEG